MTSADNLRNFLEGWKEAAVDDGNLPGSFPEKKDFEEYGDFRFAEGEYENLMLQMLDEGRVGIDGFRYCWPEVAKENRRRTLAALSKQGL